MFAICLVSDQRLLQQCVLLQGSKIGANDWIGIPFPNVNRVLNFEDAITEIYSEEECGYTEVKAADIACLQRRMSLDHEFMKPKAIEDEANRTVFVGEWVEVQDDGGMWSTKMEVEPEIVSDTTVRDIWCEQENWEDPLQCMLCSRVESDNDKVDVMILRNLITNELTETRLDLLGRSSLVCVGEEVVVEAEEDLANVAESKDHPQDDSSSWNVLNTRVEELEKEAIEVQESIVEAKNQQSITEVIVNEPVTEAAAKDNVMAAEINPKVARKTRTTPAERIKKSEEQDEERVRHEQQLRNERAAKALEKKAAKQLKQEMDVRVAAAKALEKETKADLKKQKEIKDIRDKIETMSTKKRERLLRQFGPLRMGETNRPVQPVWENDECVETDELDIEERQRKEAGTRRVMKKEHLIGKFFTHPLTDRLYEVKFIYWDSVTDKLAVLRRAYDGVYDTDDRFPYQLEGDRGVEALTQLYEEKSGLRTATRRWPQSEAEMIEAQMEDPKVKKLMDDMGDKEELSTEHTRHVKEGYMTTTKRTFYRPRIIQEDGITEIFGALRCKELIWRARVPKETVDTEVEGVKESSKYEKAREAARDRTMNRPKLEPEVEEWVENVKQYFQKCCRKYV